MIAHISCTIVTQIRYNFQDGRQNGDREILFYKGAYHEMLRFCLFFQCDAFFWDGVVYDLSCFLVYASSFGRLLLLLFIDFAIF